MNPLEETTIKLVAEGEAKAGIIRLNNVRFKRNRVNNETIIIEKTIPPVDKQEIYNALTSNNILYEVNNWNELTNGSFSKNNIIKRLTEQEIIYFSTNEESLRDPNAIHSRDFNRILNTDYVKNNEAIKKNIEHYLHNL